MYHWTFHLPHRYFNPLPPQGKTHCSDVIQPRSFQISIHFPHRGRHPGSFSLRFQWVHFNPLPPQGKTRVSFLQLFNPIIFQSTSPTGEDTLGSPHCICHSGFQSTSPTGEDTFVLFFMATATYISIHFPHRGRHVRLLLGTRPWWYFNPLPPQGKTRCCSCS